MGYLATFGPRADPATALTWGLMGISIAVVVIITMLVVVGALLRGVKARGAAMPAAGRGGKGGLYWIGVGSAITTVALLISLVWTVQVLAKIDSPSSRPALTIEIVGHQWWWEARYLSGQPGQSFTTANELHIPTGQPVRLKVTSADVIHSFWVPALTGKTDTIPGRMNIGWMQADRPGVYRGQCTEYCGMEHAGMALYVVAEPQVKFEAWRQAQLASAPLVSALPGQAVFDSRCGRCHTVRGTSASGQHGPDLTHLMSRSTIASGILPDDTDSLSGWISNPQALKPGAAMPATHLNGVQLTEVVAYLETLK
jgi:cytochrome c oxidase subunit 2